MRSEFNTKILCLWRTVPGSNTLTLCIYLLVKSFTGNSFSSLLVLRENKAFSHQLQLSAGSYLFKSFTAASNSDLAAGYFSAEAASSQQRSRSLLSQPYQPDWIAEVGRVSLHVTALYLCRANLLPHSTGTNPHSTCNGHLRIQYVNRNFVYRWRDINIQFLFEEMT